MTSTSYLFQQYIAGFASFRMSVKATNVRPSQHWWKSNNILNRWNHTTFRSFVWAKVAIWNGTAMKSIFMRITDEGCPIQSSHPATATTNFTFQAQVTGYVSTTQPCEPKWCSYRFWNNGNFNKVHHNTQIILTMPIDKYKKLNILTGSSFSG